MGGFCWLSANMATDGSHVVELCSRQYCSFVFEICSVHDRLVYSALPCIVAKLMARMSSYFHPQDVPS